MAPSRAALRCPTLISSMQLRPSPHLLFVAYRVSIRRAQPLTTCSRSLTGPHWPLSQLSRDPWASPIRRQYSQETTPSAPEPPDYLSEGELHIFNKIKAELQPVALEVQDISGGCGSMYALQIESPKFKGLTVIKQHKLVNEVLKEEIAKWHGVQLRTKAV